MDIAVLIKQVPVSNNVSVDPETHALIRASAEGMINPADLNAIEEAMMLKEQTGGKVVVFTMGPPDAEKALREAMAHGCDESCPDHRQGSSRRRYDCDSKSTGPKQSKNMDSSI